MRVEFLVSAASDKDFPSGGIPDVVLAGRSNVGKSSLINRLSGKKGLARTSSAPGKTRYINFYRIGNSFHFVDLPGFGYAKVQKTEIRRWKNLVELYFRSRSAIALVIHLVDARLPPTKLDLELARWLDHLETPRMVVATKADKLSGNKKAVQLRALSNAFGGAPLIMASAATGLGYRDIWNRLAEVTRQK